MGAIGIRQKLQAYINNAEDKKVKAIYTMVEADIEQNYKWWEDKKMLEEMDNEYTDFNLGKTKKTTLLDIQKKIKELKKSKTKL